MTLLLSHFKLHSSLSFTEIENKEYLSLMWFICVLCLTLLQSPCRRLCRCNHRGFTMLSRFFFFCVGGWFELRLFKISLTLFFQIVTVHSKANIIIWWASSDIKRLSPVLNENLFCLIPAHTCVAGCAWNGVYIYILGIASTLQTKDS